MLLVTGGAGFIGSNFVLSAIAQSGEAILNLDKLTYAGNLANLDALRGDARHVFVQGDVGDRALLNRLFDQYRPRAVVHFAAESHVDRSILGPAEFVQTNVVGTFCLLEEARAYWERLNGTERAAFRFLHVSTDEVYGSLGPDDAPFTERTAYAPNSPYAASKAASDQMVRAYHHTYGLPTLITNCSNNYGPYQFPEKLIPLVIRNALAGEAIPVYGDGKNVRDWLYVRDHCDALQLVLESGRVGETYNIGGNAEKSNIDVVRTVCELLEQALRRPVGQYLALVSFVKDRPGHDRRYAMDAGKMHRDLNWRPKEDFVSGMRKTIAWYLDNKAWVDHVTKDSYGSWLEQNYGQRGAA